MQGELSTEESIVEQVDPRQAGFPRINTQGPYYIVESSLQSVREGRGLQLVYVLLGHEKLCPPNRHGVVRMSLPLLFKVPSAKLYHL